MTRYSKITFTKADKKLLNEVRACVGDWSTALDPVIRLRARLKDLQNFRCVVCVRPTHLAQDGC
jgi:hypothetical protein